MALGFTADELYEGAGYAQYWSDLKKTFPNFTHYGDSSLSLVFPYDHGQGFFGTSLRHWDEKSDQAAISVGIQLWVDHGSKGRLPTNAQIVDAMRSTRDLLRRPKP
jgi:hypothetical protein